MRSQKATVAALVTLAVVSVLYIAGCILVERQSHTRGWQLAYIRLVSSLEESLWQARIDVLTVEAERAKQGELHLAYAVAGLQSAITGGASEFGPLEVTDDGALRQEILATLAQVTSLKGEIHSLTVRPASGGNPAPNGSKIDEQLRAQILSQFESTSKSLAQLRERLQTSLLVEWNAPSRLDQVGGLLIILLLAHFFWSQVLLWSSNKDAHQKFSDERTQFEKSHWERNGVGLLLDAARRESTGANLAQVLTATLANYVHARAAALYSLGQSGPMLLAVWGFGDDSHLFSPSQADMQLVDRCAQEQALMRASLDVSVPEGDSRASGPSFLMAVPLRRKGDAAAVLLLYSATAFDVSLDSFFMRAGAVLAAELFASEVKPTGATRPLEDSHSPAPRAKREDLELQNLGLTKVATELEVLARQYERASTFKSEFLANISHELRTPLSIILVLSKLLAENRVGNLGDKQVEYCNTIQGAGRDLLELINQLLDQSKIESGVLDLIYENIRVERLLEPLRQQFEPLAKDKGLDFVWECAAANDSLIQVDPGRYRQVLKNLVSNALKFTETGVIKVRASIKNNSLEVVVSDTGIGIPKDKLGCVFEPFRQVDSTISRRYGGTGLGLSISHKLVQLLRGQLTVDSVVEEGTNFVLTVPVEAPPGRQFAAASSAVSEMPTVSKAPPQSRLPLLLMVEDDQIFSAVFRSVATSEGFEIVVLETGKICLQTAKQIRPDAIILDVELPDTTGWEILTELRQDEATQRIPVHFFSGQPLERDLEESGAQGYSVKPISRAQISETLRTLRGLIEADSGISVDTLPGLAGRTVLLVDDDMRSLFSLTQILESSGLHVIQACDGADALEKISENIERLDCVLMDVMMPVMDGIQATKKIRSELNVPYLPIIALTAQAMSADRGRCLQAGANDYLAKPFEVSELLTAVEAWSTAGAHYRTHLNPN